MIRPRDLYLPRGSCPSTTCGHSQPVFAMKKKLRICFQPGEMLLLVFELNMAAAGLLMVSSAMGLTNGWLYRPAEALAGMLPAILVVGFAAWVVYRLRCVAQAQDRGWGLVAAVCLGLVAISFGAGVGKLALVCLTSAHHQVIRSVIHDPLTQRATYSGVTAFLMIGAVFAVTFILRAGRATWRVKRSQNCLHERLSRLGEQVVENWEQRLVPRIDRLLEQDATTQAIRLYQSEFQCSLDEAVDVIGDWAEQRLRLELELLSDNLQASDTAAPASVHALVETIVEPARIPSGEPD